MNCSIKEKVDIQSMHDRRNVTIDRVGVKGVRYPIVVDDRRNKKQNTVADIDISVELLHQHRGTHMSRFIEVLNKFHDNLITNLEQFILEIKNSLDAERAYTKIYFPYFVSKQAPVSKIESLLAYNCYFEASYSDCYHLKIGVEVPVTSLCPCSKEISDYGAHNQRSLVSVEVEYNSFVWLEDIIDLVESTASCEIYALLKRVDEKYVTEKAYENPGFVEDMVRDITTKLRADQRIDKFKVEAENYESIHNHSAYACVKN
jgi:GTP cyclohydrolase I